MPGRVKWSTQFSEDERQKLQDRYSLPEAFCRISFSTAEDQRNAITRRNRKAVGFKGPKLLVQRYIPQDEPPTVSDDSSTIQFEDKGRLLLNSKAETFHRKMQSKEEERNRNHRLEVEGCTIIAGLMRVGAKERDMDIEWDDDEERDPFERVDSSGMSFYD